MAPGQQQRVNLAQAPARHEHEEMVLEVIAHPVRRQEDALEQGNMLFRELERRLNEVAERIDQRQAGASLDGNAIMKAIDQRFSDLAASLSSGRTEGAADEAIRGLETKLEGISQRLDQSASQFAGIDPDLVRSLEAQVAGLSAHLTKPGAPLPEFVDISPRLKEIEKSIESMSVVGSSLKELVK